VQSKTLLLALGANVAGRWGSPRETLTRALRELQTKGVITIGVSNYYTTDPVSDTPQPRYLNAVALAETHLAPATLLRVLKQLERRAGRRTARAWSQRPLDIDILDYGGRRIGWPVGRRERGRLILPHPEMHGRAFVLVPLRDVAPRWRHPALGRRVDQLLAQLKPADRAGVRRDP
jgi:2-amino-4-hydroxy-6-hydroxymethyldihydropteridine diphosphokinase